MGAWTVEANVVGGEGEKAEGETALVVVEVKVETEEARLAGALLVGVLAQGACRRCMHGSGTTCIARSQR